MLLTVAEHLAVVLELQGLRDLEQNWDLIPELRIGFEEVAAYLEDHIWVDVAGGALVKDLEDDCLLFWWQTRIFQEAKFQEEHFILLIIVVKPRLDLELRQLYVLIKVLAAFLLLHFSKEFKQHLRIIHQFRSILSSILEDLYQLLAINVNAIGFGYLLHNLNEMIKSIIELLLSG